jgi:hypothetical protein
MLMKIIHRTTPDQIPLRSCGKTRLMAMDDTSEPIVSTYI